MLKYIKGDDAVRIVLDRIEETKEGKRIFVFEVENEMVDVHEYDIPRDIVASLNAGDILDAEIIDKKILSAKILKNETEEKRKEMKSRLNSLFSRKKK